MPILRVNQVTDYEGIDHQQKSERAGPHATSGRRALQRLAQCRLSSRQASWFGPDASVGPTLAMTDSARLGLALNAASTLAFRGVVQGPGVPTKFNLRHHQARHANHERFNCEPLASSAHSRRQWSQQVQRVSALLGQALAGLDCRSLQRGQRSVLERRERAGVSIVTRAGVNGDQPPFETHE
jgi:hypothetical protein